MTTLKNNSETKTTPVLEKKQRRKKYLPKVGQGRLLLRVYLVILVMILVSGTLFYLLANKKLSDEFFQIHSSLKSTMEMLLPYLIIVYIVGLLSTIYMTIVFTHSIAGPVFNLKRVLDRLAKGDFSVKAKLRKTDELKELAEAINSMTIELQKRETAIHDLHKKILQSRDHLLKAETKEEMLNILKDLEAQTEQMNKILIEYSFEGP